MKTHALYTSYRNFSILTLVGILVCFSAESSETKYTESQLKKIATLVKDSPRLRQSLPRLKAKATAKDVEARLIYGKALISAKQYDEALTVLKTINTDIESRALLLMAHAYNLKSDASEEARVLEILRKSYPLSEFISMSLADAYNRAKMTPKSVEILRALIKKYPKKKAAYFQLLDIYEGTKNTYETRILLADMVEVFKNDADIYTRHCKYYAVGGFLEQAVESCTRAITLAPNTAENHVYYGITQKNLKEIEQAEKILKKAAQQFPKSELAQYTAGQLLDTSKNWEVSSRYYKTCTTHHPESDRCQRGLANAAFEMSQYEVALKAYAVACQKDPDARNDFRNAITFLRNKRKTDVADDYNKKYEFCGLKD